MDFSQVVLAAFFAGIQNHHNIELSEDMLRHMILNTIRANKKKLYADFGELVICCDDKHSWRREAFPYYKAKRRVAREESEIDWTELYRIVDVVREELSEFFPYKVLKVPGAEADDIIGVLCHEHGTDLLYGEDSKILILSGDKDYKQLHTYANVSQYDPVQKRFLSVESPTAFLQEHILKGDTGDGIPNILSPDNAIVIGQRQKPMTQKRLTEFAKGPEFMDAETRTRFERNKLLIDLKETPEHLKTAILEAFNQPKTIGRSKLLNFFIAKKLRNLMENIPEF